MTNIKIGFCGTHGTGKTTAVNALEDNYTDAGKTICVVREVARNCPHPLGTIEAQEWIWDEQMAQEKDAMTQDVDVVICDRTVLDNLVYYRAILNDQPPASELSTPMQWRRWWKYMRWNILYDQAIRWMSTYDQVIRLPLNLEWLKADDPIRPQSEAYARRIDALFDRFVQPFVSGEPE